MGGYFLFVLCFSGGRGVGDECKEIRTAGNLKCPFVNKSMI